MNAWICTANFICAALVMLRYRSKPNPIKSTAKKWSFWWCTHCLLTTREQNRKLLMAKNHHKKGKHCAAQERYDDDPEAMVWNAHRGQYAMVCRLHHGLEIWTTKFFLLFFFLEFKELYPIHCIMMHHHMNGPSWHAQTLVQVKHPSINQEHGRTRVGRQQLTAL